MEENVNADNAAQENANQDASTVSLGSQKGNLLATVAEKIKQAPVVDRLTDLLVERKVQERVNLLDQALTKSQEARKAINKIKPDVENFLLKEDGSTVKMESFSKSRLEERKKAVEQSEKLDKAIEQALAGNFDELVKLQGK